MTIPILPAAAFTHTDLTKGCTGCRNSNLDFDFDYAFQPIVDLRARSIFAHEALVRGVNGESAYSVLQKVNDENRYAFDQACRVKAVSSAAKLGMTSALSINFLPNAVYQPEACIQSTLKAAREYNFPLDKIIFEVTEGEQVSDRAHLLNIFEGYRSFGFSTAIDDFGAGYAGLNLLSAFQPSILKLDMDLIRDIDKTPVKQAIVKGTLLTSQLIGIHVIAEGVETKSEKDYLAGLGIYLMQGYYFCRPVFRGLGSIPAHAWE
jgi:EAL domain-containing protein (putative c-di-GMP-specific phosphodiesterase class I)